MKIKEYLKNLWNGLKYDETGQITTSAWSASQRRPYVEPWLKTQPVKPPTVSARNIADIISKNIDKYVQQQQQPVYKPPVVQQPVTTYRAPAPVAYNLPGFNVDLSGIWETAGMMADNEINPQLAEIDRLLQEAGYTAEESQRAINEAYPVARRSLQKSIYENMVAGEQGLAAMGTGRGGGRQELLARAGEREATGLEGIETAKQREIGAIQRALEQYKGGLGQQRISIAGQRGGLQASYAEQLRGARFGEAATRYGLGLQTANLAEQARQFNESLKAVSVAPSGQPYATTPSGLSYFLTDADLAALGLGTKAIGTTTPAVKKTGTTLTGIQAGKPLALQKLQMERPRY